MADRAEDFLFTVSKMEKALGRIKTAYMGAFELKGSYAVCMVQMKKCWDGCTMTELMQMVHADKAHISRIMKELIAKKLVVKIGDPGKYKAKYMLSEKGFQLAGKMEKFMAEVQRKADEGISEKDLEIFYRVLFQINHNLEKIEV